MHTIYDRRTGDTPDTQSLYLTEHGDSPIAHAPNSDLFVHTEFKLYPVVNSG